MEQQGPYLQASWNSWRLSQRLTVNVYAAGSSSSRPHGSQGYAAAPPDPYIRDPQRRGSQSGSVSAYNHVLPPTSAYVPPPAFPGKQPPREQVGSIRPGSFVSPTGPPPVVPATTSYSGYPASADAYPQPYTGHSHRHSLPGAIPQHGRWQNDQAYQHPPIPSAAPAIPQQVQPPPPEANPAYKQHSLPMQYPTDRPGSTTYTPAAPPSSSFPRLNEMAMALPPLPPPPLVEMPGRTTPLPTAYGIPASAPRPATLPIPESYQYPPPDPHANPYLPQPNVSGMPLPPTSLPYAPPRPASTQIATYPLIDNRPPSSMASAPPPERPFSSASTHYPPTVTSSYHISPGAVPSAPPGGPHWPGKPGQYAPPANYPSAVPEMQPVRAQSPYRGTVSQHYEPPLAYATAQDRHQSAAYPPPASAPTWTAPEPDTRPGRNYLRSLGVGSAPASGPPVPSPYPEQSRDSYASDGPLWNAPQPPPHHANYSYAPDPAPLPDDPYYPNQGAQTYQSTYSGY